MLWPLQVTGSPQSHGWGLLVFSPVTKPLCPLALPAYTPAPLPSLADLHSLCVSPSLDLILCPPSLGSCPCPPISLLLSAPSLTRSDSQACSPISSPPPPLCGAAWQTRMSRERWGRVGREEQAQAGGPGGESPIPPQEACGG